MRAWLLGLTAETLLRLAIAFLLWSAIHAGRHAFTYDSVSEPIPSTAITSTF